MGGPGRISPCIRLRQTFAITLSATTPGSIAGEDHAGHHVATARPMPSPRKPGQENDATGTLRPRRLKQIPSIISIEGVSIILITLTNSGD